MIIRPELFNIGKSTLTELSQNVFIMLGFFFFHLSYEELKNDIQVS